MLSQLTSKEMERRVTLANIRLESFQTPAAPQKQNQI